MRFQCSDIIDAIKTEALSRIDRGFYAIFIQQDYSNNINQQYIGGNATATIANGTKKSEDSISEKFMEVFNNLPFEEQLAVMNIAVEKSKNHKEE